MQEEKAMGGEETGLSIEYIGNHAIGKTRDMLRTLSRVSKIEGISDEYYMLNKVEEELLECLMEVRRLKNHFDEIKAARKGLNNTSFESTKSALLDEMGDVYTDLFILLPSLIEIDNSKLNDRVKHKLSVYEDVLNRIYGINSVA
jgi:NTP pyrophosphatase (non-canonical NTP hydrolase)